MPQMHPMERWSILHGMQVKEVAEAVGCSGAHPRNIMAWRKEPSLGLAAKLSDVTGLEMRAFLKPGDNPRRSA